MGKIFEIQVLVKGHVYQGLNMKTGLVNHKPKANNSSFIMRKTYKQEAHTHTQREREMAY